MREEEPHQPSPTRPAAPLQPRRALLTAIAALGFTAAVPAAGAGAPAAASPLKVLASFSILADLARVVGGPAVTVTVLVDADTDTHGFELRPLDVRRLAAADLVVINGLGLEGWMQRLVAAAGNRATVVEASRGIEVLRRGDAPDPHAWHDLAQVQRYVANLRDAFSAARPSEAAGFAARAAAYQQALTALDGRTRARLAAVPADRRRVLSTHDAFGYFARAYGVEFLAVQGRQAGSEASAADVARLITQIRQQRVSAVFVENLGDPRLMERIAREAGVPVGGRLYSDALSAPGTEADSLLKLFAANAQTIAHALGAP